MDGMGGAAWNTQAVGAGLAVGAFLGVTHFGVFLLSLRFVMGGRPGGATALALAAVLLRHLLLGALFLVAWKAGRVEPLPMALGLMASWMGMRLLLVAWSRRS